MDAFEVLKADHEKVVDLFDRLEAASGKAKLVVSKEIKSEKKTHLNRVALVLIAFIMITLPGCVIVGGYSSERGWFLWPGTIVIFLVVALLFFLFKRRR